MSLTHVTVPRRTPNFSLLSPKPHREPAAATRPPPDPAAIACLILKSDPHTLSQTLQNPDFQWIPYLVNKVLKLLWNHGPKALQFFKLLDRHSTYSHTADSFNYAIDITGRLRDYRTLWSLVGAMKARRLGPTPKTFAIISERYVSAGKPDRAVKIFLSMHEHGCHQDLSSFNTLLDVLCKAKHCEMAYKLFRILRKRFRPDAITYNILANGFCLMKRTPKALEVMREMVDGGLEPTLKSYNVILNGYFRTGQTKEAWGFFLEMKRRKCEIDVVTYTTVIHGFGVTGDIVKARKVFDEMIGSGVLPSVATFNAMIQVLCKKDSVDNAIEVFKEMVRKGYAPNSTTYNVVIRGLCHVGKMDEAMEYLRNMKKDGCEPNVQTYNVIIRYYCEEGKLEKGVEVFETMGGGSCLPNLDTYNVLISMMFVRKRSDDLVLAGKLLIEMVDRGFLPRKFTFNRILNGLLLTGNQEFAKEILSLQSRCGHLPRHFRL